MSDISTEVLRQEINAIIKTADLSVITGRKVREQIEKKLKISLATRKKDVDSLLMESIKQRQEEDANSAGSDASSAATEPEDNASEQSDDDNDSSSDDYKGTAKKRSRTPRKAVPKKKRKSINAQDTGTESDEGSDSDYEIPKAQSTGKKSGGGGGGGGEKSGAASGRKGTGFTRAYTLSPELSALMGAEALPRHEVVKKVWAIIKERNLYDPKNKQFAICDAELLKVMKVKRFRTFGMLKHLKPHFLN